MILVDTSVWIDYFNGTNTSQSCYLDSILGIELIGIGDLILTEVLRGFRDDNDFSTAKSRLLDLTVFDMLGQNNAIA